MAAISLPVDDALLLSKLAHMPTKKVGELFTALSEIEAGIYYLKDIEASVRNFAEQNDINLENLSRLTYAIINTRISMSGISDSEFVDSIISSVESTSPDVARVRDALQAIIVNFISIDGLFLSIKATQLAFENERQIHEIRIISDLRPVFGSDPNDVRCVFISKTLKIDYMDSGVDIKSAYYAMDDNDLLALERAIDRIKKKSARLSELAETMGVNILEAKT